MPIPDAPPASDLEVGDSLPDALEGLRATAQATKDAVGEDLPEDLAGLGQPDVGAALQAHSNAIAQEVTDRTAAVAAEAAARVAADAAVQDVVDANEAAATAAIAAVQADVDANEATAAAATSAEASARAAADTALSGRVDDTGAALAAIVAADAARSAADGATQLEAAGWFREQFITGEDFTAITSEGGGTADEVRAAGGGYWAAPMPHDDRKYTGSVNARLQGSPVDLDGHEASKVFIHVVHDFDARPDISALSFARTSVGQAEGVEYASGVHRVVRGPNLIEADAALVQGSKWLSAGSTFSQVASSEAKAGGYVTRITADGTDKFVGRYTGIKTRVGDISCAMRLKVPTGYRVRLQTRYGGATGNNYGSYLIGNDEWQTAIGLGTVNYLREGVQVYIELTALDDSIAEAGVAVDADLFWVWEGATFRPWTPGGKQAVLLEDGVTNLAATGLGDNYTTLARITQAATGLSDAEGLSTAARYLETTEDGQHYINLNITSFPATGGKFWVDLKHAGRDTATVVILTGGTFATAEFNLTTGALVTASGCEGTPYLVSQPDGFWRAYVSIPATETATTFRVRTITSGVGDITKGVIIGHHQVEATSFTTWHDPTDGTRANEALRGPNTDDVLNADTGCIEIIARTGPTVHASAATLFRAMRDATVASAIQIYKAPNYAARWIAAVNTDAGTIAQITLDSVPHGWNVFRLSWTGTAYTFEIGALSDTDTATGTVVLGTSDIAVGFNGAAGRPNIPIADVRLSSIDRSGDAMPTVLTCDGDTTWLLDTAAMAAVDRDDLAATILARLDDTEDFEEVVNGTWTELDHTGDQLQVRVDVTRDDGSLSTGKINGAAGGVLAYAR